MPERDAFQSFLQIDILRFIWGVELPIDVDESMPVKHMNFMLEAVDG